MIQPGDHYEKDHFLNIIFPSEKSIFKWRVEKATNKNSNKTVESGKVTTEKKKN